ncbi:GMC oxidoreductase [Streptomyces sp. NPDC046942]|uniref:GMC oxidoreductase n=1 Tax=Streptomyces sp. NPDC046942 TaxID=3155137 RepID=UPI0033D45D53
MPFHQEGRGPVTEHALAIGPCVLAPTSRGAVTLRSPRPDAAPRIVHNWLTTAEDRDGVVAGTRITLEIAAQPAVADLVTGPYSDAPDPDADDTELLAWAQRADRTPVVISAGSTWRCGPAPPSGISVSSSPAGPSPAGT